MRWIPFLSTAAVLAGCVPPRAGPTPDAPVDHVRLEIRNDGQLDAVVYAYRLGQRYRLGFVVAHSVATVTLPLIYTDNGAAVLYIHHIGERADQDVLSNAVQLSEGEHPVLFITPDPAASSLAVFPERVP